MTEQHDPMPIKILLIANGPEGAVRIEGFLADVEDEVHDFHRVCGISGAIEFLSANHVKLVIIAPEPGDFGGVGAIGRLREHRHDIPIVVMAENEADGADIQALKAGAQDYVAEKNFKGSALTRIIRYAIERQHDKARIKTSELFLRSTLDALFAHIAILDETGRIITVNQAWRNFAKAANAKPDAVAEGADYLHVCDVAEGEDAHQAKAFGSAIRDVIRGGTAYFEMEYPCHDDTQERWFLGRVTPFPGNDLPRKVVVSHLNITDRVKAGREKQRLEEQLRSAQKLEAIGTLVGGIAHDFNNILSAVIGYTDLILEQADAYPEIRGDLEEIATAGRRARDLVSQLLSFSRQAKTEAGPIQVHLLVKEALKMLRAALPSSIEIVQEILWFGEVMVDPGQIRQVVMNLCTNAYHAMRENGGVLKVRLEEIDMDPSAAADVPDLAPGAYMRLVVADTGIGMDEPTRRRIFDPYFSTKEKGEGSGLGLSVVYGIVRACGGAVTVDSRPGEGAIFTVLLPLLKQQEREATPVDKGPPPGGRERILFIDDEPVLLRMVKQMLGRIGYRVDTLSSSIEALAHFKANPEQYDMVISDMTMPGLAGDQLALELLRIRPELPVILCTGFSERIDRKRASAIGVRALVMKPLTRDELTCVVRNTLDQRNP